MQLDIREIQSGSEVRDADGAKLGMVVSVGTDHVRVKTDGVFAKEYFVPRSAIVEVEERRIEIDSPKSELDNHGWSQPPTENASSESDQGQS
jgi:hypothetical protein